MDRRWAGWHLRTRWKIKIYILVQRRHAKPYLRCVFKSRTLVPPSFTLYGKVTLARAHSLYSGPVTLPRAHSLSSGPVTILRAHSLYSGPVTLPTAHSLSSGPVTLPRAHSLYSGLLHPQLARTWLAYLGCCKPRGSGVRISLKAIEGEFVTGRSVSFRELARSLLLKKWENASKEA